MATKITNTIPAEVSGDLVQRKIEQLGRIAVGDWFLIDDKLHLLAQVSLGRVALICITESEANRNFLDHVEECPE